MRREAHPHRGGEARACERADISRLHIDTFFGAKTIDVSDKNVRIARYPQTMKKLLCIGVLSAMVVQAQAALIQFDLKGTDPINGLRGGNEHPVVVGGGTGGEIGSGIVFNDVTLVLTIATGWGVSNGFTNLTGAATAGHLHGPTASGGVAAFTQDAAVKYALDSLAGWNPSLSAGGFNGTVTILAGDVVALENGQFYMNVHTAANGGGEIRGYLTVVPEPSSAALLMTGALGMLARRRRRP